LSAEDFLQRRRRDVRRARHLPLQPTPQRLEIPDLIGRVAGFETRLPVTVTPGPPARVFADADQLEQLLINLIRNAADAAIADRLE